MPNRFALSVALTLSLTPGALAQAADFFGDDDFAWGGRYPSGNETVQLKAGFGAMLLEGDEYVFNGDKKLSRLIWQSRVPVLRGSLAVNLGSGFSVRAQGSAAAFGTSYMEDYDWLGASDADSDWTHRSQHGDTRLEHYMTASLSAGYDLVNDGQSLVRINAGVEYTDVKWSAYGGTYVYSVGAFRDTLGAIPDGTAGVTYRQQFPEIFARFDGDVKFGNVRWGGMLRGGLTVYSRTTDDHWLRDLQVRDYLAPAPTFAAGTDVGFAIGSAAEIYLAARYSYIFRQRGSSEYFDTTTGNRTIYSTDAGGGELRTFELTGGLKGTF